jgi:Na+-transporting methylmalonyl-CoA/oxaloacetate decarboxylase gamma subunit
MNDISLALQITGVGMGLVFGAIIVLWLMMILLTALTADASSSLSARSASDSAEAGPVSSNELFAQAAAIGVAMAMAEQRLSSAHPLPEPPTAIVSAWQLGMRTRQMTEKGGRHK